MTNYIVAFVLATIVYLIAIRYLQEFCPMSKFFKFVIYMCISALSLPAVNYIHPPAAGEDDIMSSLMSKVSNTQNNVASDWQSAQQKANALVHGGSSQTYQNTNDDKGDYQANTGTNQQTNGQSKDIIIGRNGQVLS